VNIKKHADEYGKPFAGHTEKKLIRINKLLDRIIDLLRIATDQHIKDKELERQQSDTMEKT